MNEYYIIEPEVAGGWGDDTKFTRISGRPVAIHELHYCFDGWMGDDLLESTPCYIVTEQLAAEIETSKLSGVSFDHVETSKSSQFEELYPDISLPNFIWLKVIGRPSVDDFGLTSDLELVVSKKALGVLERFKISHALIRS
ncbi:hypothetical protein AB2M62_10480 [Sphingomonas sp. MMS12-HWE2-04]|uniref:hypothetical protein n=1 Tax=Sphingomonas sp. MMS12-HWE2-04 TaxID=3234199 RepID=UPI00384A4965